MSKVVKNTKFNKLNLKVNNSENKVADGSTLIHLNQYNTDKQNLEKKTVDVDKKIPDVSGLVTTTILNTKFSKAEGKIPNTNGLVNTTAFNTKIGQVESKIPDVSGLHKKIEDT